MLLNKVTEDMDNNHWIMQLNKSTINHVLYKNGINPTNYATLGNLYVNPHSFPHELYILLVNKNITKT